MTKCHAPLINSLLMHNKTILSDSKVPFSVMLSFSVSLARAAWIFFQWFVSPSVVRLCSHVSAMTVSCSHVETCDQALKTSDNCASWVLPSIDEATLSPRKWSSVLGTRCPHPDWNEDIIGCELIPDVYTTRLSTYPPVVMCLMKYCTPKAPTFGTDVQN